MFKFLPRLCMKNHWSLFCLFHYWYEWDCLYQLTCDTAAGPDLSCCRSLERSFSLNVHFLQMMPWEHIFVTVFLLCCWWWRGRTWVFSLGECLLRTRWKWCGKCCLYPHVWLLPTHHLLSAFPAIILETAGKSPLVQIQRFPHYCCVLFHRQIVLFPLPQQGNWVVMWRQAGANDVLFVPIFLVCGSVQRCVCPEIMPAEALVGRQNCLTIWGWFLGLRQVVREKKLQIREERERGSAFGMGMGMLPQQKKWTSFPSSWGAWVKLQKSK